MKTTTNKEALQDQIDGERLAQEALETILFGLAMFEGIRTRPAQLSAWDCLADVRSSALSLYMLIGDGRTVSLQRALSKLQKTGDVVDADFDEMESRSGGGGAGAIYVLGLGISFLLGYLASVVL